MNSFSFFLFNFPFYLLHTTCQIGGSDKSQNWRTSALIRLPIACEAIALPFELDPVTFKKIHLSLIENYATRNKRILMIQLVLNLVSHGAANV